MYLVRARVTNYKSVLDSEWFGVGQLTCLVGKNESGKTALLEALEKMRSARGRDDLISTEYPRMNWSEYEESEDFDTAVETEWHLSDKEVEHVKRLVIDPANWRDGPVVATKTYENKTTWDVPVVLKAVVASAIASSSLTAAEKAKYENITTTSDLIQKLKALESPSVAEAELLNRCAELWPTGGVQPTIASYLVERLPAFVYYSQYDRLPGRVSVDELLRAKAAATLGTVDGARIFLALLAMVGTTPEAIRDIATSEELISKLEAVQTRLSKRIFSYWSQNKHLKVQFRLDEASPGDPPPFNTGKVFQTRIENTRHGATIRLDERSTGFIWFFSFLVWFSQVQKEFGERLVVLLDEPGLTLHARAQADLLRYIKTELLANYQVLYTTHSPFMIDSEDLLSCRTVEDVTGPDDEVLGTKVGDQVFSTDTDTVFPLQAALGYDITQTLFVGEHTLLVEGPSDLLYLQWASNCLRELKRTALDPRWTITPCGGVTKIPSFLALFGGSKLHVAVLTDFTTGDKKKVRDLRESDLLNQGHVFSAEAYAGDNVDEADVEDILGRDLYAAVVNQTYSLSARNKLPAKRPDGASPRVVVETEEHFRTLPASVPEFDHFTPSSYLISHPDELSATLTDGALDRFEALFADLNAIL